MVGDARVAPPGGERGPWLPRAPRGGAVAAAAVRAMAVAAVELLVPRACVACGAAMGALDRGVACGTCWSRLPLLPKPWCARCGHPVAREEQACPVCAQLDPSCSGARSVCWVPHRQSSPLLAALKYQGWWRIADAMADRMARTGRSLVEELDAPCFVPVPLAPARLRERGFNQSERLASALASRLGGKVLDDVLVRVRATVSQTQLTPAERRANVQHAFDVPARRSAAIRGTPIVLVDDVLTTGATLNACATALVRGGASDIRYWTFGRARSDADRP
ncbi:MAG: ComF family protein [Gemmatimonadota bacterium]|nr:ComF family protein [Gemmatimonadota bacterium]